MVTWKRKARLPAAEAAGADDVATCGDVTATKESKGGLRIAKVAPKEIRSL